MRVVSFVLEAVIALVFIFGVLGALIAGSRAAPRPLARRATGLAGAQAWVSGFGGSMGWDGAAPGRKEK